MDQGVDEYFIMDKDKQLYEIDDIRPTQIPEKFIDFVLTEPNMKPQESPVPGQLYKPEYETARYGRDSLKMSSIVSWNYINRKYYKINPEINLIAMSRNKFKEFITTNFLQSYI